MGETVRSAVVTGGQSGIGAAIAARLKQDGLAVSIFDKASAKGSVDVTSHKSLENGFRQHRAIHGGLDVLVCSAGLLGPALPVATLGADLWRQILDVNLTGTFLSCQAALPYLIESEAGRIVIIASLAGKEGTPNASAYSASKAGVIALAKSLGKELVSSRILVNAIAPAGISTALLDQTSDEFVQIMIDKSPMKRLGRPEEVAELAAWLSSEHCTFSTGAVFDLSGGRATY